MQVDAGSGYIGMAEDFLNDFYTRTTLEKMCCTAVAEDMRMEVFVREYLFNMVLEHLVHGFP